MKKAGGRGIGKYYFSHTNARGEYNMGNNNKKKKRKHWRVHTRESAAEVEIGELGGGQIGLRQMLQHLVE